MKPARTGLHDRMPVRQAVHLLAALVAVGGATGAARKGAHMQRSTMSLAGSPFVFGAGGVGSSLDAVPFYHDRVWHLFHMQTRPQGIAHRVSRDLVHWEIRPLAIPGDAATGNVVARGGRFFMFYTVSQTVHMATSDDLNQWTPSRQNPVAVADGTHYVGPNFGDPYVFYNDEEACWGMLIAAETPGTTPFRAGCVGLYKSTDLQNWRAAEPLWSPGTGPRHECPQVIRHQGRWYLFDLERQDQYRVARSLAGPWTRPPDPYVGSHTVLAGTRLASDGQRWVRFPFICALANRDDFGDVVQAELYAVPRQLDFRPDGAIGERPVVELTDALRALPPIRPLARAAALSGRWRLEQHGACARSLGSSGTLLLNNAPANVYLEADVTLSKSNMEASVLLRVDPELTRGYKLTLLPATGTVSLRPFSYWDRDRVLVAQHASLPSRRPIKLRVFLSGTVLEAFIGDRVALTSRVYRHPTGAVALEAKDGTARFDNLIVRTLSGDP